jgi:hypothetical protein
MTAERNPKLDRSVEQVVIYPAAGYLPAANANFSDLLERCARFDPSRADSGHMEA